MREEKSRRRFTALPNKAAEVFTTFVGPPWLFAQKQILFRENRRGDPLQMNLRAVLLSKVRWEDNSAVGWSISLH